MDGDGSSRSDELRAVRELYRSHGVGKRVGFGAGCALIIVDFQRSYTRTWRATSLGPVENTARLLSAARQRGVPVIFTYMGYEPDQPDAGVWGMKASTLIENIRGSEACQIDPLIEPREGELVLEKRVPSAFFGSGLAGRLREAGVDTVVVCGTSTSGCVRATVVDGLSHGFRVILPEDCVSDPSAPSAEAALSDIDTKYGDVVSSAEVLERMRAPRPGEAADAPG